MVLTIYVDFPYVDQIWQPDDDHANKLFSLFIGTIVQDGKKMLQSTTRMGIRYLISTRMEIIQVLVI